MVEFKYRLRDLMDYFKLSQSDLSNRTGINKSMISLYLSGDRNPKQDRITLIAETFGVSLSWLIGVPDAKMFDEPKQYDYQVEADSDNYTIEFDRPKSTVEKLIKKVEDENKNKIDMFFYITREVSELSDQEIKLVYDLVKTLRERG